jgi:hypothetical protein
VATEGTAGPHEPGGYVGHILADLAWLGVEAAKTVWVMLRLMLFIDARKLAKSASARRRYEGHGYFIWALALWTFAIPELYGAISGRNGRIPTLSNTVGNLINVHDWMSVFVVGLLFFGVAHVARIGVPKHRRAKQQHEQQPEAKENLVSVSKTRVLLDELETASNVTTSR